MTDQDDPGERSAARRRPPAPALVLGGVLALQSGSTVAREVIPLAGVAGTVALRAMFGAVMLTILRRPCWPTTRRQLALAVGIGIVLAVQHLSFYAAIHRLPLGVAVTVEFFCGPLALAFVTSRRPRHLLWVLVAAVGVVLASDATAGGQWHALGLGLALVAGVTWAMYIVLFPRLGPADDRGGALTTVALVAAAIAVPYGIAVDHSGMFTWKAILLGAAVALLADVTAYSLQARALSRVSARTFSVLSSTQPAVAAVLGLAALGQAIDAQQWIGVVAVTAAAAATAAGVDAVVPRPRRASRLRGRSRARGAS